MNLFEVIFVAFYAHVKFKKNMLQMLKLATNYGFHELFLNYHIYHITFIGTR